MHRFALFNRILCVAIVLCNWICGDTSLSPSDTDIGYCHYSDSNAALTIVCTSNKSINTDDHTFGGWLACKNQYGFGRKPIDIINFRFCNSDKLRDDLFKTYLQPTNFWHSKQLKTIILSNNTIRNFPANLFHESPGIVYIDLSHNAIELIDPNAFQHENRVEYLNLSFNNISKLVANSLQRLRNLKWLVLSNNQIQKMPSLVLKTQAVINQIDLSFNRIQRIEFDVNVAELNLSHNRITAAGVIKKLVNNLVNLTHLNLSSNQITNLLPNTFQNAQKLRHLNVSNNFIREISVQAFANLVNLEYLTLARNRLTKIEAGTFATLRHLKTLDISENALRFVDISTLPLQPNQMELLCIDQNLVESTEFYSVINIADASCQRIETKITDLSPKGDEKWMELLADRTNNPSHSDKNGYHLGMQVFLICAIVFSINVMILAWLNSRKINAIDDSQTIWWFLVTLKKKRTRQSKSCRYSNIHCVNLPNDGLN